METEAFKGIAMFLATVVLMGGTPLAFVIWQDNREAVAKIFTPKRKLFGLWSILALIILWQVTVGLRSGSLTFGDLLKWVAITTLVALVTFCLMVCALAHAIWKEFHDGETKEGTRQSQFKEWYSYILLVLVLLLSKDDDEYLN